MVRPVVLLASSSSPLTLVEIAPTSLCFLFVIHGVSTGLDHFVGDFRPACSRLCAARMTFMLLLLRLSLTALFA